jgi:DNA-dependent metalloprotease WSS1
MSRNASTELEPLVNNFEHLSDKRRAPEALRTLRKIASLVKPLMRQRNWRVGTLAEFFPSDTSLLGLNTNRGQKISLRLRHAGDENQFLPIEQVIDTMLHELAHNVHGPHDQHFHALWDKLRDEHQALVMKGYTGEGFLGQGNRLGGRGMPMSEVRRQARAAAERRKVLQTNSGQRLGGTKINPNQDPRPIIAAAAERRNRVERGCASNTARGREIAEESELASSKANVTRTMVEHEDEDEANVMQAYIDLIQEDEKEALGDLYIPPSQTNPAGSKSLPPEQDPAASKKLLQQQREIEDAIRNRQSATVPKSSSDTLSSRPSAQKRSAPSPPPRTVPPPPPKPEAMTTWTCEICTLVNPLDYLTCDACTVERPPHISASLARSSTPPNRPPRTHSAAKPSNRSHNPSPALAPRLDAYTNHQRFEAASAAANATRPVGWTCGRCGNFMESMWWTCSVCGCLKESSS